MRKSLEDIKHMVKPIKYFNLPEELRSYNYYIVDGGHCIMCLLEKHLREAQQTNMDFYEVPVPVKYVLEKGYRLVNGYVVVEAEYDPNFGLDVDDKYFEY